MAAKMILSTRTKRFFIRYGIYVAVLLLASVAFLSYVGSLLRNYEACQPENVAKNALQVMTSNIRTGKAEESFDFDDVGNDKFGGKDEIFGAYIDSLEGKTLSITPGGRSYSGEMLTYDVLADGEKVAVMTLEASSTTTKLIVFTTSDWKVTKIVPSLTVTTYSYYVRIPSSFSVSANGIRLGNDEFIGNEGDFKAYELKNLITEPTFVITDSDGNEADYDIVKNEATGKNDVTPVLYKYDVKVPESFGVIVNGTKLSATSSENGTAVYSLVRASKPTVTLTDAYGGKATFEAGEAYRTYRHTVTVPEGYTVSLGGKTLTDGALTDPTYASYLAEFGVDVPKVMKYELTLVTETADFTVKDENGNAVSAAEKNCTLDVTNAPTGASVPSNISAELDVLEIARTWSKYLTNDLDGAYYGFAEATKYLKQGSYLYNMALAWVNSENPLVVSGHWLGAFENESVTNYREIAPNCFAVDVRLTKVMHLDSGKTERDEMKSTFYFVKDGRWYLAAMIDITD